MAPASAGHYQITWTGADGSLNGETIDLGEYDTFTDGDCPWSAGSYSLTDHYSYEWVPETSEAPEDDVTVLSAAVLWDGTPTYEWEQANSTSGLATGGADQLSASWYNTIDGQGGGTFYPAASYQGTVSQEFRLSGSSGTFDATWTISTTRSGYNPMLALPYWDYMSLQRAEPRMKHIVVLVAQYRDVLVNGAWTANLSANGKWAPYVDQTLSNWRIKLYYAPVGGGGTFWAQLGPSLSSGLWSHASTGLATGVQSGTQRYLTAVLQYQNSPNSWGTPSGQNAALFKDGKIPTHNPGL